jgi:hypothetical protein
VERDQVAARQVTEDEIDELLEQLTPFFRKHKKMHEAIQSEVNQVLARQAQKREAVLHKQEEDRKRNILLREHLQEIEQRSPSRSAEKKLH